ncbi:MAG TPA: LacI family DNA-binding transcriptional regulator [Chloroflexota bacterium]|nr:LacI family DNA-binding transcriptional regulator [Chloroflexota bacterium]
MTLKRIAQDAGVSLAAVSLAVNGRPGVSDETRERVQAVARK